MNVPPLSSGKLAQIACILEATARKAGNVHRHADFERLDYLDFLLSASMIVEPLDRAWSSGIGRAVLDAVVETRRVVATNTNLGMILLLAPLAAVSPPVDLRNGVRTVLRAASRNDAKLVYEAIRLAAPGGMGTVPEEDVADEPNRSLVEVMRLAADRDLVAAQYANGFGDVFDDALPVLRSTYQEGYGLERAIVQAHLALLASHPDTLIERKRGRKEAQEVSRRAGLVLARGGVLQRGIEALVEFDAWLREDESGRNPGATADLITAAIFVALRENLVGFPRLPGIRDWTGTNP